jgi:hypothetical protein
MEDEMAGAWDMYGEKKNAHRILVVKREAQRPF